MEVDPSSEYSAVAPKFITRLLRNDQPEINGDGRQSRDFTYVRDVVEANMRAADLISYSPRFSLQEGLREAVAHYRCLGAGRKGR